MAARVPKQNVPARLPVAVARKIDQQLSPDGFCSRGQFIHYAVAKELAARGESFDDMILGSPWWPTT